MKAIVLAWLTAGGAFAAQAGGWHHHGHVSPSFSFYYGGYPCAYPYPYGYGPGVSVSYAYSPTYGYGYDSRPNYAVSGTMMGALAGGIIGDSIHHQGWEGAAIGAAAGLVLGGIAESSTRQSERAAQVQYVPVAPSQPVAPPAQAVTMPAPVWNPPIKAANATYYWTAPPAHPQIPDAPRVPDAPPIPN